MEVTGGEQREQDPQQSFLERIARADGELIALEGKRSKIGEQFYVCARIGDTNFWGDKVDRLLIVDLFAKRNAQYLPVGHYDWEIKGTTSVGNKNRHGHLPNSNKAHEVADKHWSTGEGFGVDGVSFINYAAKRGGFPKMNEMRQQGIITDEKQWMDPIYQVQGIGSFLIAVSSYVLVQHGVQERSFVSVSKPARRAWQHFGIPTDSSIPLARVLEHPNFDRVLREFTQPQSEETH